MLQSNVSLLLVLDMLFVSASGMGYRNKSKPLLNYLRSAIVPEVEAVEVEPVVCACAHKIIPAQEGLISPVLLH